LSRGLWCHFKDSVWVEWKQTTSCPSSYDISLCKRLLPCRAIQRGEMLLTDCICTSMKQPISLVIVGCLQGGKYSDVIGLELVGGVRGEAT